MAAPTVASSCWGRGAAPAAAARISPSAWARPIPPCTGSSASWPSWTARPWRKADVEIGYLHRAFEKDCEVGGWNNAIPYTDRLNYVSPLINNFAYAAAVEKLLGIEVTERCQYIRMIMSEISRICDHLTCVGASAMELGAFTVFLYMIKAREYLWELVEDVTGARLTISYGRVGGVKADLPDGFADRVKKAFGEVRDVLARGPPPPHRQPHLHGPHGGGGRPQPRGDHRLRDHRAAPARGGRPLRRAPGPAALGLRPRRVRGPHPEGRRQLRPLPGPHGGDGAVHAHRRAGAGHPARAAPSTWTSRAAPIDPAAYVDRGKQGKTDGLLLIPITLSPNLQGQDRGGPGAGERRGQARGAAVRRTTPTAPSRA